MTLPAFGTANLETCNGIKYVPSTHPILNRFDGTQKWELRQAEKALEEALSRGTSVCAILGEKFWIGAVKSAVHLTL